MRKRREQAQNGYVRTELVGGREVYVACYASHLVDPQTGKRKRRIHRVQPPLGPLSKMTREQAEKKKDKVLRTILGKQMGKRDARTTFRWFVDHEFIPTKSPQWGPAMKDTSRRDRELYIYPYLGHLTLEEISTDVLQKSFLNQLGESGLNLSKPVVMRLKTHVFSMFKHAVETEYLVSNPAASSSYKLPRCKPKKKMVADLADVGRLINAISNDRDFVIMKLASVGTNPSEIFAMQWKGLHLDETTVEPTLDDFIEIRNSAYLGEFHEGRTKTEARERQAFVDSVEMKAALFRLREKSKGASPDALIFPGRIEGQTLWAGSFLREKMHPLARKLGISVPMTFQVLRRTFMTWMDNLGLDRLLTVQGVVGHTKGSEVTRGVYVQQRREKEAQLVRYYAAVAAEAAREYVLKQEKRVQKSVAQEIANVPLPVLKNAKTVGRVQ